MISVITVGIVKTIKVKNVDDLFIFMPGKASLKVFCYQQIVLMPLIQIIQAIFHKVLNHPIIQFSSNQDLWIHSITYQTLVQHLSIYHLNLFEQFDSFKWRIRNLFPTPFLILTMNYTLSLFMINFAFIDRVSFPNYNIFTVNFPQIQLFPLKSILFFLLIEQSRCSFNPIAENLPNCGLFLP